MAGTRKTFCYSKIWAIVTRKVGDGNIHNTQRPILYVLTPVLFNIFFDNKNELLLTVSDDIKIEGREFTGEILESRFLACLRCRFNCRLYKEPTSGFRLS